MRNTFHVYPSGRYWAVQTEGQRPENFRTRREALEAARKIVKKITGQIAIHGRDGGLRGHESYGIRPIPEPRKKSPRAKEISRAVGQVALEHLLASTPL